MSFTVTATQGGATENGMATTVVVVTGAAGSQPGQVAAALQATPSLGITPQATGSWVYGALLGSGSSFTALAGTTFEQNSALSGLSSIQFRTTGTTTASTPVTVGAQGSVHGIGVAVAEILASGTLAEDASSPAPIAYAIVKTQTTAAFSPPAGSLLVLMVATNGNTGTTTMAVTDTSGLGLTWVEQSKANGSSSGYAGVWTAAIPGGGTPHTATASLTVTPSFSAARTRGKHRTGALTVTPSFSAARTRGRYRTAALTVVAAFSAARQRGKHRTAALTVTPVLSASAGAKPVPASSTPTVTPAHTSTAAVSQATTSAASVTHG